MGEVKFKMKPVEEKTEKISKSNNTAEKWIKFDTKQQGLETVMKDYQEICMRFLWERGEEGAVSRDA